MNTIMLKIQVAIYTRDRASCAPTNNRHRKREVKGGDRVFMPAMRVKKLGADRVELATAVAAKEVGKH